MGVASAGGGQWKWEWRMNQPIPSYLASVAISEYETVNLVYNGNFQPIPIELRALAADTQNVKSSFANLSGALDAFEGGYGEHQFDKVGYVVVSFQGGAMEHPTNIAYPKFAVNGNTSFESLMAHELSHHWWGDLVTCKDAGDMWINEGWASFSEALFDEEVYGKKRYNQTTLANHHQVMQYAHIEDGAYYAISGVPHAITYGSHSYNKGADVVHTLRGYMGDSLFFSCAQEFLKDFAFSNASSYDLRDYFSNCSGIDLTWFFEGWVFNPGFPHFSIDSMIITQSGSQYLSKTYVRQRLNNAPEYYRNIPLGISYFGDDFTRQDEYLVMDGRCGIFYSSHQFMPTFSALDFDERISDAITDEYITITSTGSFILEHAMMDLTVNAVGGDSALVRIEHHFVAPDPYKTARPGLHLSDYRYWKIDGLIPAQFDADARVRFNGLNSLNGGYLDNNLITNSEDSLVILYRQGPSQDWTIHPDFTINTLGSPNNKFGLIDIHHVSKGEYTLAIYDANRNDTIIKDIPPDCVNLNTGISSSNDIQLLQLFPNPAKDIVTVKFYHSAQHVTIQVNSIAGELVDSYALLPGDFVTHFSTMDWAPGTYVVTALAKSKIIATGKVIILK